MKEKKLNLIGENSSPLFRIMSIYNHDAPNRAFANNVCAFHVGKGIIISVAHSLRVFDNLPMVISDSFYQNELRNKINSSDRQHFDKIYPLQAETNLRILTDVKKESVDNYVKRLDQAKVDRSFGKLYSENCCKPFLVTTFRKNAFCDDVTLNAHFSASHSFAEPSINRHTFIIELEMLDLMISEDIAIYRIINTPAEIINKLPFIDIDYQLHDTGAPDYFCLQSAPYNSLGRILNEVRIEGLLDDFANEKDLCDKEYIFEGLRYLIKGYFRFGSSGAPYLIYDREEEIFKVNAVQSQASFIQLSINGKMEGNLQYVNGIATPLSIIEQKLRERLAEV